MRFSMVIDLKRCVGCYACVMICKQEHFLPPGVTWGKLIMKETGTYPNITKYVYPILCNHCAEPACIKVCPTNATYQRKDGVVVVDADKCVGCRSCLIVCPYQIRTYISAEKEYFPGQGFTEFEKLRKKLYPNKTRVVSKCNFCQERIDAGLKKGLKPGIDREATPACVNICPAKARIFDNLDDPDNEVSKLIRRKRATPFHPEYGTEPSVYYVIG